MKICLECCSDWSLILGLSWPGFRNPLFQREVWMTLAQSLFQPNLPHRDKTEKGRTLSASWKKGGQKIVIKCRANCVNVCRVFKIVLQGPVVEFRISHTRLPECSTHFA